MRGNGVAKFEAADARKRGDAGRLNGVKGGEAAAVPVIAMKSFPWRTDDAKVFSVVVPDEAAAVDANERAGAPKLAKCEEGGIELRPKTPAPKGVCGLGWEKCEMCGCCEKP